MAKITFNEYSASVSKDEAKDDSIFYAVEVLLNGKACYECEVKFTQPNIYSFTRSYPDALKWREKAVNLIKLSEQ